MDEIRWSTNKYIDELKKLNCYNFTGRVTKNLAHGWHPTQSYRLAGSISDIWMNNGGTHVAWCHPGRPWRAKIRTQILAPHQQVLCPCCAWFHSHPAPLFWEGWFFCTLLFLLPCCSQSWRFWAVTLPSQIAEVGIVQSSSRRGPWFLWRKQSLNTILSFPSLETYPDFGAWCQEKLRGVMHGMLVTWLKFFSLSPGIVFIFAPS